MRKMVVKMIPVVLGTLGLEFKNHEKTQGKLGFRVYPKHDTYKVGKL